MYNSLTGCEINSCQEDIKYYFDKLDRKEDGIIDLEEYKEAMIENQNLYEWFEFANRGIADDDPITEIDHNTFRNAIHLIEKELHSCLDFLAADRISRHLSDRSSGINFISEKPSVISFGDDEFNEIDRPTFNNGDDDLPDEIIVEENRQSLSALQSKLNSILSMIQTLKDEKELN